MYPISDNLTDVMRRSHTARYVMDAFYDGIPTLSQMPVSTEGSITTKASGRVQTTASISVASNDAVLRGRQKTIAPEYAVDALATYGQEVVISRQIWFGSMLVGQIPCGTFRISGAPTIAKYGRPFGSDYLYTAVAVDLDLDDRFDPIDAAQFTRVVTPPDGATMWSEVRRLSPYPVVVAPDVPDQRVQKTMVYEENRLDTITDLLALAGAEPKMTREGNLSARLTNPTAAPIDLTGTIKPFTKSMSNDFKNRIVVQTTVDGGTRVLAEARVTSGPLRTDGPAGERVELVDSGLAQSDEAARALANARLAAALQGRRSEVKLTCLPNLTLEAGDPVTATDSQTGETVTGVVTGMTLPMDPTKLMDVTIGTQVYV